MPSNLARPVKSRQKKNAVPLVICQCTPCLEAKIRGCRTGEYSEGRISLYEWGVHQKEEQNRRLASTNLRRLVHVETSDIRVSGCSGLGEVDTSSHPEESSSVSVMSLESVDVSIDIQNTGLFNRLSSLESALHDSVLHDSDFAEADSNQNGRNTPTNLKYPQKPRRNSSLATSHILQRRRRFIPNPAKKSEAISPISADLSLIDMQLKRFSLDILKSAIQEHPLKFTHAPTRTTELSGLESPQLVEDTAENYAIISHEAWLTHAHFSIRQRNYQHSVFSSTHDRLRAVILTRKLELELVKLRQLKQEEWQRQVDALPDNTLARPTIDTAHILYARTKIMQPVICICYLLVSALYLLANLSTDDCNFVLSCLQMVLRILLKEPVKADHFRARHSIPTDVRTVIQALGIDPVFSTFACCPVCFCTYKYDTSNPVSCPAMCAYQSTPGSPKCDHALLTSQCRPIRSFLYQDLHQWIGRMYARPDIEQYLDDYPRNTRTLSGSLKDMWHGSMLQQFCGPDGSPWLDSPANEGRLIFGLNMDGFSPYSKKKGGKKVSVCGIYMVCYNLPPDVRYKTENVFLVGIVPGPNEPSLDQVNHYIRPLVDDLLVLWFSGIHIKKTTRYPLGRSARAAMLPLVCDLPAARRASGHSSHSAKHFCSECHLSLNDINNLDRTSWIPRNLHEHLQCANMWKEARTLANQETIFSTFGVRWSELLRLPYWDPTKHVVIDPMHGFFLRIFFRHIREIWGMNVKVADGDGDRYFVSEEYLIRANYLLRNGSIDQLNELPADLLKHLSRKAGINPNDNPKQLVRLLQCYRLERGWFTLDGIHIPDAHADQDMENWSQSITSKAATQEEHAMEAYRTGTKMAISKLRKQSLLVLCNLLFQQSDEHFEKMNKAVMVDRILTKREKEVHLHQHPKHQAQDKRHYDETDSDTDDLVDPRSKASNIRFHKRQTVVLGKDVLKAVRDDMEQLCLPSHISRAPKHPGEVKWGNFKAEEWKSFCTINLPITLTRLWGRKPKSDRYRKMLDNFMELVAAVKLANLRNITEDNIRGYDKHMNAYLKGLLDLYPSTKITPYQHLSLHFADQLLRFGPTHSWRCYAFERYNGLIQRIPTNNKFGELEVTMFKKFCQAQNLRALFHKKHLPASAYHIIELYEKRYKISIKDTILGTSPELEASYDWDTSKLESARGPIKSGQCPGRIYSALCTLISCIEGGNVTSIPRNICMLSGIERTGQLFQSQSHPNNAHVMFQAAFDAPQQYGVLDALFTHERWSVNQKKLVIQTFALIRQYQGLVESDIALNPYRHPAGGQLCYDTLLPDMVLVPFANVICHAGYMPIRIRSIRRNCIYILPLHY